MPRVFQILHTVDECDLPSRDLSLIVQFVIWLLVILSTCTPGGSGAALR